MNLTLSHRSEQLTDFEFHDAKLTLLSFTERELLLSAEFLSIHHGTPQNQGDRDMELQGACLRFGGFRILRFLPSRNWKKDRFGEWTTDEPLLRLTDDDAFHALLQELHEGVTVHRLQPNHDTWELTGSGIDPAFLASFCFDVVEICWNGYRKPAWYELHREYRRSIRIVRGAQEESAALSLLCHDEDVFSPLGISEPAPQIDLGLSCSGEQFWSKRHTARWGEALLQLQQELPEGITLKCCATCRFADLQSEQAFAGELLCQRDRTSSRTSSQSEAVRAALSTALRRDITSVCRHYRQRKTTNPDG